MTLDAAHVDEMGKAGPTATSPEGVTQDTGDTDHAMTKPTGRSHSWQELSAAEEKEGAEAVEVEMSATTTSARSDSDSARRGTTTADGIPIETGPVETHAAADSRVPFGSGPERTEPGVVESGTAAGLAVEYKVYKRRWFGLLQLALLNIMVSWDWLTFSPVAGEAATYFNTTETTINWLSTAFFFAFCFATPLVIYVLHLGPKLSIVTSASLLLVGNWLRYAGAHSSSGGIFGLVMFGQILTGFSQCFVLAAPTCYSDLWFTHRGRVAATALTSLANPFGAALGQLIVPFWVNTASDIPDMVLYVSIISTVCALPSFFIPARPPTPAAPSNETPKLSLRAAARILFSQLEFWLLFLPFAVYVGLFNSTSSLLNQILEPHGYSDTDAGIAGALLIVVGLVAAAATSPIIDRTKSYLTAIRVAVPVIGLCYLVFIWMPNTRDGGGVAGPYVVLSILGAASFSLVPVVVEYLVELTHPISPAVTSTLAWSGGQLLGGVFVIVSGALKGGDDADPPGDMRNALIFAAVVGLVAVVPPLCLGLFGRKEKLLLRRVRSDEEGRDRDSAEEAK